MHIDVISCVKEAQSDPFAHKTAIVVDVLRSTTTMVAALALGCTGILPAETIGSAKLLQQQGELLCGERFCKRIPGFDYGNSPLELQKEDIAGKRLIMTTSNGTRAVHKAVRSEHLLMGSLVNARACALQASQYRRDVVILCAGAQDTFCLEDGLCAGGLIHEWMAIYGEEGLTLNDFGCAMLYAYKDRKDHLKETLQSCPAGKKLQKLGFGQDLTYCSQWSVSDVVPIWEDGTIVKAESVNRSKTSPLS
jgi:2-phosphosulfolactate phosphatase